MFTQVRQYAPLRGVAASALATQEIPADGTYYGLYFRFLTSGGALITEAQLKTDVTLFTILVDGNTYIEGTGEYFLAIMDYYFRGREGYQKQAGVLYIPLSRDYLDSQQQADTLAWGTADINNITVQIQFAGAITTASVEIYGIKTDENRILGLHVRTQRFPQNAGATGEKSIPDLPKEPGSVVWAYHIFFDDNTSGISQVILTIGATDVLKLTDDFVKTQTSMNGRYFYFNATGNTLFPVDFCLRNDLAGGLPMSDAAGNTIKDLRLRPTFTTAAPGNFTVMREAVFGGKAS